MEYGEMIAGAAAALESKTGKIGYLGPLINDETRRLAVASYLGARYAWIKYRGRDPNELSFKVTWIGFWFNIPGVTADPTQVADDFYNSGYDVVLSGIDTTEVMAQAKKQAASGKIVRASPYDYVDACNEAPEICLGVPYSNWGPDYARHIKADIAGAWKPSFEWSAPDWKDINNPDTSAIGFRKGDGLSAESAAKLDRFIEELAGGLNLWSGPLDFQDGSEYLKEGETATDRQVWYLPQMLKGMEGQSVPSK
jgi:simple sugar transport system substrate-binding protein